MAYFDKSGDELRRHRAESSPPHDFGDFWGRSLAAARDWDLGPEFRQVPTGLKQVSFYDAAFTGFGGQRVRGWYALPVPSGPDGSPLEAPETGAFPVIVQFIGYGGGRGLPVDWLPWLAAGYAIFAMDTRGQGSSWRAGATPDGGQRPDDSDGPQVPGYMTRGIRKPETYYFCRLFVDAARAVEAACAGPGADPNRLVITGGSQGGALTIAAAALTQPGEFDGPSLAAGWQRPEFTVRAAMPDVPFLCDIQRAIGLVDNDPYHEVVRYLRIHRDQVAPAKRTLSFVDCAHLAAHVKVPGYFSVALMDGICPPSTVYAAYNAWAGPKEIVEYPFNQHEGGQNEQFMKQVAYVSDLLD